MFGLHLLKSFIIWLYRSSIFKLWTQKCSIMGKTHAGSWPTSQHTTLQFLTIQKGEKKDRTWAIIMHKISYMNFNKIPFYCSMIRQFFFRLDSSTTLKSEQGPPERGMATASGFFPSDTVGTTWEPNRFNFLHSSLPEQALLQGLFCLILYKGYLSSTNQSFHCRANHLSPRQGSIHHTLFLSFSLRIHQWVNKC